MLIGCGSTSGDATIVIGAYEDAQRSGHSTLDRNTVRAVACFLMFVRVS